MKCPKCGGRQVITTSDQVSFYKSWVVSDESGGLDIEDGKRIDDGDWWIDPSAEASCDVCDHHGFAKDFAEAADKSFVADALDFFLHRELSFADASGDDARHRLTSELLRLRGREDLAGKRV